ncbi:MAG: hypothetical protein AB7E70_07915 [Hyphomicrobiaceae bacterium]
MDDGATRLEPLSQWISLFLADQTGVPRAALLRRDARVLEFAERSGILRRFGVATEISCRYCGHVSCVGYRVVSRPEGRFRHHCLENGRIDLSRDDVELLTLDRDAMLGAMATAAGRQKERFQFYAGGRLARIGFIERPAPGWTLGYADGIDDENALAGVIDAIVGIFPDGPGLIATPSHLPINMPLPRRYKLLALHDLVYGCGEALALDTAAIETRLERRKKAPGNPGRPSRREATSALRDQLQKSGNWPSSRVEQARVIRASWAQGEEPPALETIGRHLREADDD